MLFALMVEIIDVTEDKTSGPLGDCRSIAVAVVDRRKYYTRINLHIEEGVSHVDIIETIALPEFPCHLHSIFRF